jgi:hypothetical protein
LLCAFSTTWEPRTKGDRDEESLMMSEQNSTIWVSKDAKAAQATPAFVIKQGDVFYMTLAVWEFDASKATPEQIQDCNDVRDFFDAVQESELLQAAPLQTGPGGFGDLNQTGQN